MIRVAAAFTAMPLVVLGTAGLAATLWPGATPAPAPPITLTVTTVPPRTVTIVEPLLRVALVPLPASTHGDAPVPDLDGDGVAERFETQPDSCGTGGCVYDVYLSSAPEKPAGTIAGKWGYWTVTPRRNRAADLTTTWFSGCCTLHDTTYRFSRGAYREVSNVSYDPRTR
jgi:hypothetical protein